MSKLKFVFCTMALAVTAANADINADGKITINGLLITETCKVTDESKNIIVTLPTVSTTKLAKSGDETGSTTFTIGVTDCPTAITKVAAHFEANGSTGYSTTTGNLLNAAPAASGSTPAPAGNVEVRLYDNDGTSFIEVGKSGKKINVDATTKGATLRYAAGYYATAATTPGPVTAMVQYVLDYN